MNYQVIDCHNGFTFVFIHFAPHDMPHSMNVRINKYKWRSIQLASSIVSIMLICFNVSTMNFNKQTKVKQTEANESENEHFLLCQ